MNEEIRFSMHFFESAAQERCFHRSHTGSSHTNQTLRSIHFGRFNSINSEGFFVQSNIGDMLFPQGRESSQADM